MRTLMFMLVLMLMSQCKPAFKDLVTNLVSVVFQSFAALAAVVPK